MGITVKRHDTLPLAILNYDQIESPKTHPVVRECRALTLHAETKAVVAKSFNRFFNWGEVADQMKDFDFSDFGVQSKEDGSLVVIYNFEGKWMANTRGSFATDKMQGVDITWQQGFCKAMNVSSLQELSLPTDMAYICEFCSPWNKVVRRYEKPVMYILTAFRGTEELNAEMAPQLFRGWSHYFVRPTYYSFKSIEEVQAFLQEQAATDPTFEGVVIRDKNNQRWKIKSSTYLGLHKMRGEGDNMFNPKHLLPFVMTGEQDELLTYFPEVTEQFFKLKSEVQAEYIKLLETWVEHKGIEDQKEFALTIRNKTPFTALLFNVRKHAGKDQTVADLKREWRDAESMILKWLKA